MDRLSQMHHILPLTTACCHANEPGNVSNSRRSSLEQMSLQNDSQLSYCVQFLHCTVLTSYEQCIHFFVFDCNKSMPSSGTDTHFVITTHRPQNTIPRRVELFRHRFEVPNIRSYEVNYHMQIQWKPYFLSPSITSPLTMALKSAKVSDKSRAFSRKSVSRPQRHRGDNP